VIGGNDVLGAVLLFRHEDLRDISVRTFERSSSVIGIVLLSQERVEASKSRDVSDAAAHAHLAAAGRTRPDTRPRRTLRARPVAADLVDGGRDGAAAAGLLGAAPARRRSAVGPGDGRGRRRAGHRVRRDEGAGRAGASSPRSPSRELGDAYRGVLSRPVRTPAEMPALYATLRRALSVLGRLGMRGNIVGQNEMALYSVLFETHDQASLNTFLNASHRRRDGP
jgi:hypothetical protein